MRFRRKNRSQPSGLARKRSNAARCIAACRRTRSSGDNASTACRAKRSRAEGESIIFESLWSRAAAVQPVEQHLVLSDEGLATEKEGFPPAWTSRNVLGMADTVAKILPAVTRAFPEAQAVYLFGSFGTPEEHPKSDLDLAVLLPPGGRLGARRWPLLDDLETTLGRRVDLVSLREVDTVLSKEVISADRRVACFDPFAADEFEMLTLSYYQKLNEERREIIADALATGRFYA